MKKKMQRAIEKAFRSGPAKSLRSAVTWEAYSSLGGDYGDTASYADAVTIYAHLVQEDHKVLNTSGQEEISTATLVIPEARDIDTNDRITLPDGSTPQIIKVNKLTFAGDTYGVLVYLGKSAR